MDTELRTITIADTNIHYTIKRSKRRRRSMALGITHQGVSIMVPWRESYGNIERLIILHAPWIIKKLASFQEFSHLAVPETLIGDPETKQQKVEEYLLRAETLFKERVEIYSKILNVHPQRLNIGNQKKRWGSCNRRGVVSLNWRLVLVPLDLLDYVVVHELCHLVHLNHSQSFWRLVETVVSDYKNKRKALHKMIRVFEW